MYALPIAISVSASTCRTVVGAVLRGVKFHVRVWRTRPVERSLISIFTDDVSAPVKVAGMKKEKLPEWAAVEKESVENGEVSASVREADIKPVTAVKRK